MRDSQKDCSKGFLFRNLRFVRRKPRLESRHSMHNNWVAVACRLEVNVMQGGSAHSDVIRCGTKNKRQQVCLKFIREIMVITWTISRYSGWHSISRMSTKCKLIQACRRFGCADTVCDLEHPNRLDDHLLRDALGVYNPPSTIDHTNSID